MPVRDEFICHGKHYEEDYVYHLPDNLHILAVPDGVSLREGPQTYKSVYALSGNTLTASRRLDDDSPGPTCTADTYKALAALAEEAKWDIAAQIVYK
jgi:hypothetical protein